MSVELLDAECEVLASAVRAPAFPRALRAEARKLLQAIFRERSAEAGVAPERVAQLVDEVEALLRRAEAHRPMRLGRLLKPALAWPVRLRAVRQSSAFSDTADRYLGVGKAFEARVEWMWQRCKRSTEGPKRELTVQERAASEMGAEDLEFVWGRKRP